MADAIIIGAGMSGLAAGIRLAMFGQKVVLLEKHSIPGGLNSYYQRRNFDAGGVRQFDVGLHALTNFVKKGEKNRPFTKLLKQLRLSWDDFKLQEQSHSVIHFPDVQLKFSNDFELLASEVRGNFPHETDGFNRLVEEVKNFNELDLSLGYQSSRQKLKSFLKDPLLVEMLLCPLLIYGSAWEDDMDFAQFVVMFKSLYFEGFSRPEGGVRRIISLLLEKFQQNGGEIRFRSSVARILTDGEEVKGVRLDSGEEILGTKVFSSMGLPETYSRIENQKVPEVEVGKMSFLESIFIFDKKLSVSDATIVFYNDSHEYKYRRPNEFFDPHSAVVCLPDNYGPRGTEGEGMVRVTNIANYEHWREFERPFYEERKAEVSENAQKLVKKLFPDAHGKLLFQDTFTPTTIERYTWHFKGTVYGSPTKLRDGRTPVRGLYIIGTDQGFLGIVGAILSGISMANLHGLMEAT